jgi:hypothetical protein
MNPRVNVPLPLMLSIFLQQVAAITLEVPTMHPSTKHLKLRGLKRRPTDGQTFAN